MNAGSVASIAFLGVGNVIAPWPRRRHDDAINNTHTQPPHKSVRIRMHAGVAITATVAW